MIVIYSALIIVVCLGLGFTYNKFDNERKDKEAIQSTLNRTNDKARKDAERHSKDLQDVLNDKMHIESSLKQKEHENAQKQEEINNLHQQLQARAAAKASLAKASTVPSAKVVTSTGSTVWDSLAQCESGGNWAYNGPSGYDGGLQFLPSTWTSMQTGYQFAWQAPREVQIAAAEKLQARSGWGQWPACTSKLGLR